jgi:uncharacterized FlaG/YvyC family protein
MDISGIPSIERSNIETSAATVSLAQWTARERAENQELVKAVKAVNASGLLGHDHELTFAMDREARKIVARVVDTNTNEVILQIPGEQVLRMAQKLPIS